MAHYKRTSTIQPTFCIYFPTRARTSRLPSWSHCLSSSKQPSGHTSRLVRACLCSALVLLDCLVSISSLQLSRDTMATLVTVSAGVLSHRRLPHMALTHIECPGCHVASAFGATKTVVADINEDRVNFAVKEGFSTSGHVLPMGPRPKDSAESLSKAKETATAVLDKFAADSDGFDVVLECTGVESCMQAAIHVGAVLLIPPRLGSAHHPVSRGPQVIPS